MDTEALLIWFAIISAISIIATIYDKIAAKAGMRRISEKALMSLGLIGGALPMFLTMLLIRHKTRHPKFMVGLPFEVIIHIVIILLINQR